MRTFLVPKIGTGTRRDPFRPKYCMSEDMMSSVIKFGASDAGEFFLVESADEGEAMDGILAQPDVHEIEDTEQPIEQKKGEQVRDVYEGKLAVAQKGTGRELLLELRAAIKVRQSLTLFSSAERGELAARVAAQVALESGRR